MANSKRVRRVALVAVIAATGLPLLLLGIAHLPMVRAYVLERARDYAARELGIALDAKSLHYNLLGPSVELRDIAIRSVDDKGGRALLHADSLRLALGRGLVLGEVEVTRLELVRPRIAIVRHADGTLNLPRGRGAASSDVTPLRLGRADVRQLTVSVDDEASGRSFEMGPIDLSIDTSSATPAPGAFGPSPFSIRFQPQAALSGTVAGRLAFDGTRLFVPALTIEAPEGRLALDGSIDVISPAPRVDVRARSRVDLARAAHLAALDRERISGTLHVTGRATGLLSAPAVQVSLEGSGLAVRSFEDITLAAASTIDGGRLHVSAIDLRSPLGVVHAKGDVALAGTGAGAGAASHVAARWSDVDLDAAIGSLGYALPARLGSRASGTADLRLAGTPAAWLSGLDADVSTTLRPVGAGLSLAGTIDAGVRRGAWSLQHGLASAPAGASLAGTLRGRLDARTNDSSIGGGARLRVRDLAAVYALARDAGATLPEQLATLRGRLDADVRVSGTAARPAAHATLRARDVHAAGFGAGTVDAAFTATREALRIENRGGAAGTDAAAGLRFLRLGRSSRCPVRGPGQRPRRAGAHVRVAGAGRRLRTARGPGQGHRGSRRRWTPRSTHRASRSMARTSDRRGRRSRWPATGFASTRRRRRWPSSRGATSTRARRTPIRRRCASIGRRSLRSCRSGCASRFPSRTGPSPARSTRTGTLRQPMPESADATLDALDAVVNGTRVVLESPAAIAWTSERRRGHRREPARRTQRATRASRDRWAPSPPAIPCASRPRVRCPSWWPSPDRSSRQTSASPRTARWRSTWRSAGRCPRPCPTARSPSAPPAVAYGDLPPATDLVVDARVDPARIVLRSLGAAGSRRRLAADAHRALAADRARDG